MAPTGLEPAKGKQFTYQTTPAGKWDGVIHCQVLEVTPNKRLAYAWRGGHDENIGYGPLLATVVTGTLTRIDSGNRLHLVHSGFRTPPNYFAFKALTEG